MQYCLEYYYLYRKQILGFAPFLHIKFSLFQIPPNMHSFVDYKAWLLYQSAWKVLAQIYQDIVLV